MANRVDFDMDAILQFWRELQEFSSQAGDIDFVELGHSKDGIEREIFNYSIAYDRTNRCFMRHIREA